MNFQRFTFNPFNLFKKHFQNLCKQCYSCGFKLYENAEIHLDLTKYITVQCAYAFKIGF